MSTIKKDSLWIFKPHRTVLINNKTTNNTTYSFTISTGFYLPHVLLQALVLLRDIQVVGGRIATGATGRGVVWRAEQRIRLTVRSARRVALGRATQQLVLEFVLLFELSVFACASVVVIAQRAQVICQGIFWVRLEEYKANVC